jgi:hypothetical protein
MMDTYQNYSNFEVIEDIKMHLQSKFHTGIGYSNKAKSHKQFLKKRTFE